MLVIYILLLAIHIRWSVQCLEHEPLIWNQFHALAQSSCETLGKSLSHFVPLFLSVEYFLTSQGCCEDKYTKSSVTVVMRVIELCQGMPTLQSACTDIPKLDMLQCGVPKADREPEYLLGA